VVRAVVRQPDLPVARLDGVQGELRLLVDHRQYLGGRSGADHFPAALASA
jgi:hypothetical protein